jgi:hypothetical protein
MKVIVPVRSISFAQPQPDKTWGCRLNMILDMTTEDCKAAILSMAEVMPASKFWGIIDMVKEECDEDINR